MLSFTRLSTLPAAWLTSICTSSHHHLRGRVANKNRVTCQFLTGILPQARLRRRRADGAV